MGYENGDWSIGQWLAMGTMMLLFWGMVIGLVVWARRSYLSGVKPNQTDEGRAASADNVLAERYARGEIEEEEYRRRRELLHSAAVSPSGDKTAP